MVPTVINERELNFVRWDYGYQIAGMADRTTLVDNNTWNNTHIAVTRPHIGSSNVRLSGKQCQVEKKYRIPSS